MKFQQKMMSNYVVTALMPYNKKKMVVSVNEEKAFSLYNGEIRRYSIEEGRIFSDAEWEQIHDDILYPRAKERALNLLTGSSKTSAQIRRKLRDGYYPEVICDKVIAMLEKYGYLNDYEFARYYVEGKLHSKSANGIYQDLRKKGIPEDIIRQILDEQDTDEIGQISAFLCKKGITAEQLDYKMKAKVYASLLRKGYNYDDICVAFDRLKRLY